MTTSKIETSMCSYSHMAEGIRDKAFVCHEGHVIAISLSGAMYMGGPGSAASRQ